MSDSTFDILLIRTLRFFPRKINAKTLSSALELEIELEIEIEHGFRYYGLPMPCCAMSIWAMNP